MIFDSLTQKVKAPQSFKTSPTVTLQRSITPQKVRIFRKRKMESLQKGTGLFSDFVCNLQVCFYINETAIPVL